MSLLLMLALSAAPPPAPPAVRIVVDTSDAPEAAEWAKKAKATAEKWHPIVSGLLASKGYTAPADVRIVFKKDMKGVAYAQGRTITVAASWIKAHPEDLGMIVHELTHVVQGYRRGGPSWLVEGIADYVRFFHYEPGTKINVNPRRASYKDSYRTTAKFLAWVATTHDKDIVSKMNAALREGTYKDALFEKHAGKNLDALWKEFVGSLEKK